MDLAIVRMEHCGDLDPKTGELEFRKVRDALHHMASAYLDENENEKALPIVQRKLELEKSQMTELSSRVLDGGLVIESAFTFDYVSGVDFCDTYNRLGGCLLRLGKLDEAMTAFKEGLQYATAPGPADADPELIESESWLLNNIVA